ncbi:MAG: hypothetical protein ACLSFT_02575 [Ruminococcus callidus]
MYTVYTDDDGNTTGEDFKGENLSPVRSRRGRNRTPTVYFLSGHGEKSLTNTKFTTNLTNQLRRQGTEPVGN